MLRATRGPFIGGYTSSVPPFMAGPDQLVGNQDGSDTNSSRDCVIDPSSGSVSKRSGCSAIGDSFTSPVGMTNKSMGFRARKVFALDSPSITDNYPVAATLLGKDTNAGFPTADSGFPGTMTVRSTNGTDSFYSLLEEFGTTHYKTGPSSGHFSSSYNLKVVPVWYESGDGVYTRGALTGTAGTDMFMQQFLTCGSRAGLNTQNWYYSPNLRATPWRWNKRLNESSSAGTEVVRIYPTGPFPPLFPPTVTTPSADTSGTSWSDGDTFFISVIFQFEDGSYSAPVIPRAPVSSSVLTGGFGFITVGTIGGTNKYRFLTYSNIAIGPEGTIARVLLRTTKQTRAATTDNVTVAPLDLRVLGVLKNNTQTTFLDYGGDDDNLVEDENVVRLDLICPRRARYIGTGDQRVAVGYTLPNTAAIMLALTGVNTSRQLNVADTNDGHGYNDAEAYLVRITSTHLQLLYLPQNGTPTLNTFPTLTGALGGNGVQFAFSTYDTLEKLVDAINTTSDSSCDCEQWAAQLAPGIDGTMPSASLTLTTMDVANCTTVFTPSPSTTLTTSGSFASVGVGMKISGTGITAGTYVVSKASNTSLTMSAAPTANGTVTLTFYQETGDNAIAAGGTVGYMRCFGPNYPLLLHMKPSAFPKYDSPDKQGIYYTMASPGAVQAGSSQAPNSFLAGNKLVGHSSPRQQMARTVMGIVDVEGAAVVAYSDGISLLKNVRGGNTGEDFDCRLFTINDGRGCISGPGLVSGNGWAAYPTTEGLVATDKTGKEIVISGDVFNSSELTGDIAYEIKTSAASAASDSDDQYFVSGVIGTKLYVAYRPSPGEDAHLLAYDFSRSVDANGLEELIHPERRTTHIWSPPAMYNDGGGFTLMGALGSLRNASGRQDMFVYDVSPGSTGDCVLVQFNTGTQDGGVSFSTFATMAPVVASEFMALTPQRFEATHLTTSASASIVMANNQTPTFNTSVARTLRVDPNRTRFNKQTVPIDQSQRGKTDMFWLQWRSTTNVVANKLWRLVLEYGEVENDVAMSDLN